MEPSAWIDSSLSLALNLNPHYHPHPHPHPAPPPKPQIKEAEELAEELSRVIGENRKLTEMLAAMYESYTALQTQFEDLMRRTSAGSAKRKSPESGGDGVQTDQSSSSSDDESNVFKKPRESCSGGNCGGGAVAAGLMSRKPSSRVLVRIDKSDTSLIVKDGYQWRKYGQKVTRDNPSPRAYFKCSFAPSCQVKKKVQRSAEDQTMLVATYDGEHNHLPPSETELPPHRSPVTTTNSVASSAIGSSKPTVTLDLIQPVEEARLDRAGSGAAEGQDSRPVFQRFIVEQMASSLTNDPGFKAAVAAVISGRMMDGNKGGMLGKWL
uniref:WRKY domain-containing protein n=1 Tax=Kalanchoe fedtschenkoi TaxID=63787 RepID=A0A7N0R8P4_KALFE